MAPKYQLSDDNIIDILDATNLEADDAHPNDPLAKSRKRVTLDQLRPYDNNPRTTRNPKFDEILTSIENAGLDQPPNISRRSPDDPDYMIIDGGNTRLEILKLLYEKYTRLANGAESDEERLTYAQKAEGFFVIDCVFKPWVSESRALAGHMSENENRGDLLFIEKALAVQKQRTFYDEEDRKVALKEGREYNGKPLSIRALAERITADGWTIHNSHISRYDYAANTLLKGTPEAFWAGAGHSLVRILRKYDTTYTRFWQASEPGQADPLEIETDFIEALRENDGECFDTQGFLKSLNARLGKLLDLDPATVAVEVDALMSGSIDFPSSLASDEEPSGEHFNGVLDAPLTVSGKPDPDRTASPTPDKSGMGDALRPRNAGQASSAADGGTAGTMPDWPSPDLRVDDLLEMILTRVKPLAERYGFNIEELTQGQRDAGYINPFFILPAGREFRLKDDDEAAAVWWALTKYSGSAHIDSKNRYQNFERSLQIQYLQYMTHKEHGLFGALFHLEDCIIGTLPDTSVSEALFEIQRLCGRYTQQVFAIIRG